MRETGGAESRAAALRRAFAESFALPPPQVSQEVEDLLSVRIAGDPYAIRLRDITGMIAKCTIVPVPSAAPGLLGLAGIRGDIVPVFGLASLLGYREDAAAPRWMILYGQEEPIALGFAQFEGYLRLAKSALHAGEALKSPCRYVDQIAATNAGARPVLGIHLVVAAIRDRFGQRQQQEQ